MIQPRSVLAKSIFAEEDFLPRSLCSIDPLSATAMAVAGAAGSFFGSHGGGSGGSTASPVAPTAPPTQMAQPVQQPTGQKPTAKSSTPTFLGQIMQPVQSGQKSLLGQ